jgi:hypothetical protein
MYIYSGSVAYINSQEGRENDNYSNDRIEKDKRRQSFAVLILRAML